MTRAHEPKVNTPYARLSIILVSALVLSCTREDSGSAPDSAQERDAPDFRLESTAGWVGRWNGPEGTYLEIVGGNGVYEITIKDLDRARTFDGAAVADHIEFSRDGTNEVLRATNGNDTGMKWLAEKADCLTVKFGEGYCRD